MKTVEQKRAENALSRVKQLKGESFELKKNYRSYVDRLGPSIVMNGLGQALATELALAGKGEKGNYQEKAHYELYRNLELWLCHNEEGVYSGGKNLMDSIMKNKESLYLRAQVESLAWLEWHKKFCRAFFPKNEES